MTTSAQAKPDTLPRPFRILTLDGGGTFALIQAKALDDLYPGQSGHEVLSHFDMIVGCSGGAVVASLLLEGRSPKQIYAMFDDIKNRQQLFGALPFRKAWLSHLTGLSGNPIGPRFSTNGKLNFLKSVLPNYGSTPLHTLGEKLHPKLEDIRIARNEAAGRGFSVMIVTYDFDRDRARMLRSDWQSAAANFPKHINSSLNLAEAAHASSTAPVNWFDAPAHFNHGRYWDGAMTGYNNPVLAAVSEALATGVAAKDVRVLSIGTCAVDLPRAGTPGIDARMTIPKSKVSFVPSLVKVGKMIIADPPDAHTYLAHLMLGGAVPQQLEDCPLTDTALVRMNPLVQPVPEAGNPARYGPPPGWTAEDIEHLGKLDIAAIQNSDVDLIKRMCDGWLRDEWHNQPVRHGGSILLRRAKTFAITGRSATAITVKPRKPGSGPDGQTPNPHRQLLFRQSPPRQG